MSEALDKIERALEMVSALCDGSQRWTMSVPVRPDRDPDLVIAGALQAAKEQLAAPVAPAGYKLVPIEPTEDMVIHGFESAPSMCFSKPEDWDAFEEMSGCQQAAHKARLCYAAMLAAAPEMWKVLPSRAGAPPLDDELRDILGRPCFTLIIMAQLLRSMGHDIKTRAEDEQAASIHWMLDLYMKHGSEWRTEAARIIQEFKDGLSKPTGEPIQEAKE